METVPEVKTSSEETENTTPTPDDSDIPPVPTADEEVLEAPVIEKPKEENIFATLIGLVHDVRKMQTKSGGMMLMATVESIGFDFKLVVFPRDYETYENKVIEDMIVVVDGRLRFDTERDEVSISPGAAFGKKRADSAGSIKSFSISQFHHFAGKQEEKQLARNEDGTIQLDAS